MTGDFFLLLGLWFWKLQVNIKSPQLGHDPVMRQSDMNEPMAKPNNPLLEKDLSLFGVVVSYVLV